MSAVFGKWMRIPCKRSHLNLAMVLSGGQTFRWRDVVDENGECVWSGVAQKFIWQLKQSDDHLHYCVLGDFNQPPLNIIPEKVLKDYFQIERIDVDDLYQDWSGKCPKFQEIALKIPGIRILRQNVVECLFAFICSSNNNIQRITAMIDRLCLNFGSKCEHSVGDGIDYFDFPSIDRLAAADCEQKLRQLGFGYRAKYISDSARMLLKLGGELWLENLKQLPYAEAKQALMQLSGVGAKVADCVCLMSLDFADAVPIDTHVWQVTCRQYSLAIGRAKSLNDNIYNKIGAFYRSLFGSHAGWAQTVLFCAELKKFSWPLKRSIAGDDGTARPTSSSPLMPSKKRRLQRHQKLT